MEMQSEVMIQLHKPVTAPGGEVIKQITLRSPTLRDVEDPARRRSNAAKARRAGSFSIIRSWARISAAVLSRQPVPKVGSTMWAWRNCSA